MTNRFDNLTRTELIKIIIGLEQENKFLKTLYKGTDEFKRVQSYIESEDY